MKEENLHDVESSRSDPGQVARVAFGKHMQPWPADDVRYIANPDESIAAIGKVDLADVKQFHADFYGASAAELVLVGDFDVAAVEKLADELFGNWKSEKSHTRLGAGYQARPPLRLELETPDKEGAVFQAGQRIALREDHPDYPALALANFMTGGGFLNSRLATRLRQKEGLSYGARSSFRSSPFEEDAWFTVNAIYAPQNAAKVEQAVEEELARIMRDGFTAEEVTAGEGRMAQGARGVAQPRPGAHRHARQSCLRGSHPGVGCGARRESRCAVTGRNPCGRQAPSRSSEDHEGSGRRLCSRARRRRARSCRRYHGVK